MLPVIVVPIVQGTVVTAHVVSSPMETINEHEEPVFQDPKNPLSHMRESNNSLI